MKFTIHSAGAMAIFLLVLLAALAVFYTWLYRREARHAHDLHGGKRWTLRFLRIAVAAMAILAISRPQVRMTRHETRLPVVALIVDVSASMKFPDARENPLVNSFVKKDPIKDPWVRFDTAKVVAQMLQEKLTRTHRVQVFTFSDSLKLLKELPHRPNEDKPVMPLTDLFENAPDPNGAYTNIGDAFQDALRELAGNRISGMVLLSDGRQTGGRDLQDAVNQLIDAKLPVHAVVLGSEFPQRDLRIDDVVVATEVSLGDVLTFGVKITNQISPSLNTSLTLTENGVKVNEKPVVLNRGENLVSISTIANTEGTREYRLILPTFEGELNKENNQFPVDVRVVKRTLRVLLIAGNPSREYFYLTPTLLRDPVVELSCFLQGADVDYTQQGMITIERLPRSIEEWKYDVVILLDVDPNKITSQQVAEMENMVRGGGGLMVLAGRNQGLAKLIQVHAVKVRELLPIEVDKNQLPNWLEMIDRPFKAERTAKGRGHPIMRLERDDNANEATWATFPQFYWRHPVARLKPQSVPLLEEVAGSADQRTCLMAIHRYNEGAVFYCGLDSMWRWRFPGESYDYDRFWTNVIRYLGETRLRGSQQQVSLSSNRISYSPGEEVQIRLRVLDPALMSQLEGQSLYASVTTPQKEVQMVQLTPDPRGEMLYLGTHRARRIGSMVIKAKHAAPGAASDQKPLFEVEHPFQVKMQSLEDRDTSADFVAMEKLASQTGGKYFDYRNISKVADLVAAIPTDPQVLSKDETLELWDGKIFLFLFLALISAEWSLRKMWGLL